MRLILDSHPEIICYGEPTSYNCFRQPQHIKHHASAVGFQITGSMYQLHKNNFWANSKIIYLQRNTQDVIQSFYKFKVHENFFERLQAAKIEYKDDPLYQQIYQSLQSEMSYVENIDTSYQQFASCILWLKWCQSFYHVMRDKNPNIITINYDELVLNPKKTCQYICDFLGVSWSDALLSHHTITDRMDTKGNLTFGYTDITRPIDTNSVGVGCFNQNQLQIYHDIFEMNNGAEIHLNNTALFDPNAVTTSMCKPNPYQIHTCIDLVHLMTISEQDKVLDIGCCTGRDLQVLKHLHPDISITGFDKQEHEEFYQRHNAHVDIGDCGCLPYQDQQFDVAYCNGLFSELTLDEKNIALKEMQRVAKRGYYTILHENGIYTIGEF